MNILHLQDAAPGNLNPYIWEIVDTLNSLNGVQATAKESEFWNKENFYDIIHIHWPEFSFEGMDLEVVETQISFHKQRGSKLVYTRHNAEPHKRDQTNRFEDADLYQDLYALIIQHADGVIHHGEFSKSDLYSRYTVPKTQKHVVIPHHIYEDIHIVSKEAGRKQLNISEETFVILCFGNFRTLEETNLIKTAFRQVNIANKLLLAPKLHIRYYTKEYPAKKLKWLARKLFYQGFKNEYKVDQGSISNEKLPFYFAAADCLVIQRQEVLTSGLLPMAFYQGKTIVAPRVGNITEYIEQTENELYTPHSMSSLVDAIEKVSQKNCASIGEMNRLFSLENWRKERTVAMLYDFYIKLLINQ